MLANAALLVAGIVLAVAMALVVGLSSGGAWAMFAAFTVAGVIVAVQLGLLRARRRPQKRLKGVSVTSVDQPLLWTEVRRVAASLEIPPPDELLLVADFSATVSQGSTWLGLRAGVCRLHLGLPLLAGLTERQLRSVLAHELCHAGTRHTLVEVIYRGKEILGRVVDSLGADSIAGRIVGRYGLLYLALSRPITRRHELEADRLSAELAGNSATASALNEVALLRLSWEAFVREYAEPAAAVRRRPEDLFAGFARFLEEPTRLEQLKGTVGEPAPNPSTDGNHVSLADRLAAIASLPEDHRQDSSGLALNLLRNANREIRRVEEWMFHKSGFVAGTWDEITAEGGRFAARDDARQLVQAGNKGGLGPTLSVATLLELLRHGLANELVSPLLPEGSSRKVERELATRLVTAFFATAAIESGTASYRLSWASSCQLVDDHGAVDDLPQLVSAALADPGKVSALELWLKAHEVSPERELGGDQSGVTTIIPAPGKDDASVAVLYGLALPQ
jgi:Zn-dependent protease with chaperone function